MSSVLVAERLTTIAYSVLFQETPNVLVITTFVLFSDVCVILHATRVKYFRYTISAVKIYRVKQKNLTIFKFQ
jgi:hypothetical protein